MTFWRSKDIYVEKAKADNSGLTRIASLWSFAGLDLFFYQPIAQGVLLRAKVNTYLDNGQAAEGKAFGIVFQVYLCDGSIGTLA